MQRKRSRRNVSCSVADMAAQKRSSRGAACARPNQPSGHLTDVGIHERGHARRMSQETSSMTERTSAARFSGDRHGPWARPCSGGDRPAADGPGGPRHGRAEERAPLLRSRAHVVRGAVGRGRRTPPSPAVPRFRDRGPSVRAFVGRGPSGAVGRRRFAGPSPAGECGGVRQAVRRTRTGVCTARLHDRDRELIGLGTGPVVALAAVVASAVRRR
jgi:hypothetical protein